MSPDVALYTAEAIERERERAIGRLELVTERFTNASCVTHLFVPDVGSVLRLLTMR